MRRPRADGDMNPNFFIVGAPKCGTTSLAGYLALHDQVFFCRPKEPSYFVRHLWRDEVRGELPPYRTELKAYLELFSGADPARHQAVGEGSTMYLSSRQGLSEIRAFDPAARIVVMLRNPVEIAYALHSETRFHLHEDQDDFKTAWGLQEARRRGERIPKGAMRVKTLLYGEMARIGEQLETLLGIFPRDQVMWIFFEDFKADTLGQYRQVLAFLGLPDDGRTEFPVKNTNENIRPTTMLRVLKGARSLRRISSALKQRFGVHSWGISKTLQKRAAETAPRAPLPPHFRAELVEYFRDDITRLERITGRDLSAWRTAGA